MEKTIKRLLLSKLCLAFLILTFALPVWAGSVYYVKSGGDDNAAGTSDGTAWAHCPGLTGWTGSAILSNSDIVYFDSGDTWTGSSGPLLNTTAGVTYDGSTYGSGTRATFEMIGGGGTGNNVIFLDSSNVTIKGIEVDMGGYSYSGISTYGATSDISNILINDCVVHNSSMPTNPMQWNYAIFVAGTYANVDVDTVTISDCTVYNIGHEGICVYPSGEGRTASNINIQRCTVYDCGQDGTSHPHCIYLTNDIDTILVEDCELYGGSPNINIGNKASGDEPDNITIRRNIIHDATGTGLVIGANYDSTPLNTTALIYNNIFYDNSNWSIFITRDLTTSNIQIYNNTIYHNPSGIGRAFEINGSAGTGTPIVLKNNIFYSTSALTVMKYDDVADEALVDHSNNLIYSSGSSNFYEINGVNYSQAEVKSSWDATAENTDPLFVSVGSDNYRTGAGSDAIDAGYDLSGTFTQDYYGTTRPFGSGFDIGAYEHPRPKPPTGLRIQN